MGKKDIHTKLLTRNNDVFAELFNTFLFNEDIVDPKRLKEKDTAEIAAILNKMHVIQKYRDVIRYAEIKNDDHLTYLLLGLENQTHISTVMPVRVMLYDALSYSDQISGYRKKIREDVKTYTGFEWLSGLPQEQKIAPVITLVLCWSPDQWNSPKCLYDIIDRPTLNRFGKYINDYKLNLVSVYDVSDETLRSLKTEIGLALEFSKYSKNKEKIIEFANDDRFRQVSKEFVETISVMTDTKIKVNEDGGYVNMCEGIRLLQEEAKIQGIAEGKTEGIAEGKIIILNEMVRDGDISERRAAEKANMSEEEFRKQYMNYSF